MKDQPKKEKHNSEKMPNFVIDPSFPTPPSNSTRCIGPACRSQAKPSDAPWSFRQTVPSRPASPASLTPRKGSATLPSRRRPPSPPWVIIVRRRCCCPRLRLGAKAMWCGRDQAWARRVAAAASHGEGLRPRRGAAEGFGGGGKGPPLVVGGERRRVRQGDSDRHIVRGLFGFLCWCQQRATM